MPQLLPHIPPDTEARPFCEPVDLSDEAKELLADLMTVEQFLGAMIAAKHFLDAIRLVARAIAPIQAVAWAHECVGEVLPPEKGSPDDELFRLTEDWLAEPDEKLRRGAMDKAAEVGYDGAAAWVVAAIGWSGGSIAPITAPPVDPPDGLGGRAASGAIIIAAVVDIDTIVKTSRRFLDRGLEIAAERPAKPVVPGPEPEAEPMPEDKPAEIRSLSRSIGEPTAPAQYEVQRKPPPPPFRPKPPDDPGSGWAPKPL